MLNGYGLTETAPSAAFLTAEYSLTKLGSIGQPPLLSEIRIADRDGVTVTEPQVTGEICARGPNVMKGYWNQPEATAAAIDADGWFHTGDVGYLDSDGFLYIVDRIKDMVVTGGENVSSVEVENVLLEHPSVDGGCDHRPSRPALGGDGHRHRGAQPGPGADARGAA